MHRTSLALALLAGLFVEAGPSLAAAAVEPYIQEEFEFSSLAPADEAFAAAADAEQLLCDSLARIAVEVKLRGASEAAADAEFAALAGFLRQSEGVPELSALDVFWKQHARTRRAAGLAVLNPQDREVLGPVAASFGLELEWFSPIVTEMEQSQDRAALADLTKDEVRAYVDANFPPVSNAIRFLVWDSISEGPARIEALGVRASGALAELVLNNLENPFVRPPFREGGQNSIPAVDPLLLLTEVHEEGALRLVADHLNRGGLGWATRILTLVELPGHWYPVSEDVAAIEPLLVRVLQEPQLLEGVEPRVAWFYSDSFAGNRNLEDRGLLSRALMELPAGHPITRRAVGQASGSDGFHPAIADVARRVASDPTYSEPYAFRVASSFPGGSWVLEFAESDHPQIPPQILSCLKDEALRSETTLAQRSNVAQAILIKGLPVALRIFPSVVREGAIGLTVPLVEVLAQASSRELRECLLASTAPTNPAGVMKEVLRLLPAAESDAPWGVLLRSGWAADELARPDFRPELRNAFLAADSAGRTRILKALEYGASDALFEAWLALERTPQVEGLLVEILTECAPSSAMVADHLEYLLSLAAEQKPSSARSVLSALVFRSAEEPWDAFEFAAEPSRSIHARVLALVQGMSRLQGAERPPSVGELQLIRDVLLEPGIEEVLGDEELSIGADLGSRISSLTVDLSHPLEDPEFVRAADPTVIDVLLNSGFRPKMLGPLLARLADGLPVFENRHHLWNSMLDRPVDGEERQALLAILDRRIDGYWILKRLGEQGDPALLYRFDDVLTGVPTEEGEEPWSLGERLEAIRSLGRISTLESAQVLRRLVANGRLTAAESDLARGQLAVIAQRLEQDRFWNSLESGVPGREEAVAQLVRQLASDSAPKRAAAARALGAIGATTLQPTLIELLEDADAGVRAAAAESLDLIALHVRRELAGDE